MMQRASIPCTTDGNNYQVLQQIYMLLGFGSIYVPGTTALQYLYYALSLSGGLSVSRRHVVVNYRGRYQIISTAGNARGLHY